MKSTILLLVCILLLQDNFAQNGIPDSNFGTGGLKTFSLGDKNTRGKFIIPLPDNSFVLAGNSDDDYFGSSTNKGFFISKHLQNGDLDTSFGVNGILTVVGTANGNTYMSSAIKCTDGKILVSCTVNGSPKFMKVNTDITLSVHENFLEHFKIK